MKCGSCLFCDMCYKLEIFDTSELDNLEKYGCKDYKNRDNRVEKLKEIIIMETKVQCSRCITNAQNLFKTIYSIELNREIKEYEIEMIEFHTEETLIYCNNGKTFTNKQIGYDIFFDKSQAEKRVKFLEEIEEVFEWIEVCQTNDL